jgi:hypothetical protein
MDSNKKTVIAACLLAGVLLAGSFTAMASQPSPKERSNEIGRAILKQLSYTDDSKILSSLWGPVSKGTIVQGTKGPVFTTPGSGYVLYIDLYPMANLFHPVKYVFLAEPSQQLSTFDSQDPPRNFKDYQRIDTTFSLFYFSQQNRYAPIPADIATPKYDKNGRDSRYAILMNGGYDQSNNHIRYWDDLQNIFVTLVYVYGFPDENIITLCSDGQNPAPDQDNGQSSPLDFDHDNDTDIKYSCVLSNVDYVFTSLAQNFTPNDKLFIFTTDHGSSVSGWDTDENLWNYEVLHDYHFAELLALFPEGCEKIFTLEPCFSGGFLDNAIVPPGPIVGSTAARYDEYSWAMPPDYVYDTYVFHWTAAVAGHDAYNVTVDADYNHDGRVTMDEAYQYALTHDADQEHPQYGEYPNGTGSGFSLWVSSNPPAKPSTPQGATLGIWNVNYSYTSTTTDPDGDQIYYRFNWGDGTNSGWIGPYVSGQTGTGYHIWTKLGTYNVTAQAHDTWGATSLKSDPLVVTITDNTPPLPPTISGPHKGKPGTSLRFDFQTTDPQGDNIWYFVDWGDNTTSGWVGPYVSGHSIHLMHTWTEKGNFTLKAKAKDTFDAESPWSTWNCPMPNMYTPFFGQLLRQLLEKYPHIFPILRQLLGY